ncbi:NosD domain-containing protein [Cecembia lonarensis]|nr:NosD domain-containing protein [Cecembia lonarensis]
MQQLKVFFAFLLIHFWLSHYTVAQVTYVVNSVEDHDDLDLADKTCADQFGNCTLRAAIQNANKTKEKDRIIFKLDGDGPFVFDLKKNLPKIISPLEIDGTSQNGYALDQVQIILSGKNVKSAIDFNLSPNSWANGIQLMEGSSGSAIKGLCIIGFEGLGIRILNSNDNVITSSFIGVHPLIHSETSGNISGISIDGSDNTIGGYSSFERNIISGHESTGITIRRSGNRIIGNFIGTDPKGEISLANRFGIQLDPSARSNFLIDNLISGNLEDGIRISFSRDKNFIYSNKIGTNYKGNKALPNKTGIMLWNNLQAHVGSYEKGNLISGNDIGIHLIPTSNQAELLNQLKANYIGVDIKGTLALPNRIGILIECSGNVVGSIEENGRNLISGNLEAGIVIRNGSLNIIQGNFIGTDKTGKYAIPNGHGVIFETSKKELATTENILRDNLISGNMYNGVILQEDIKDNMLFKNKIGLSKDGQSSLPNGLRGVLMNSDALNCIEENEGLEN